MTRTRRSIVMNAAAMAAVIGAAVAVTGTAPALAQSKLTNAAALTEQAPATYRAKFETGKGAFVVEVTRAWAPRGADRFYNLVKNGFYDDTRFFRVVPGFMVQFGIHGEPAVQSNWVNARIPDDPVTQSNKRGTITFATSGPGARTTQVFINFDDNANLDGMGFAPFGRIVSGMNVVDAINAEYRERPDQRRIQPQGNAYLKQEFPRLDFVKKATIER